MTTPRTAAITNWDEPDEALPDVPPGEEYEYVGTPQRFVVLYRVVVLHAMTLVRLRVGACDDVPFTLASEEGSRRTYVPEGLIDDDIKKRLVAVGAAVAPGGVIAIPPGMEVRVRLRNEGDVPTKPRAALLVQEEN